MLGVNSNPGRGYPLEELLLALSERGGSSKNLLVVDAPEFPAVEFPLPENCLVAGLGYSTLLANLKEEDLLAALRTGDSSYTSSLPEAATVRGAGSLAVSPPEKLIAGSNAGDEWVNGQGMVFCWCPPGSFISGSPAGEPARYDDEDQQPIEIKRGFWISKYEVTSGQWQGNRPRNCLASHKLHPQDMANQSKDGGRFLSALTHAEQSGGRLPAGWQYALPSEHQWEYAARAGTQSRFYFGESLVQLPEHANFADRSFYDTNDIYSTSAHRTLDDGTPYLARVGSYAPNAWGLHDVYGNLAEWCDNSTTRGGSWCSLAQNCRSAYRHKFGDRDNEIFVGFRIILQHTKD